MKIVTINFQSIISKYLLLLELISSIKPTIIVGKSYWIYINDLVTPNSDELNTNQSHKKLWTYIKSLWKENTGIPPLEVDDMVIRREGRSTK